MLMVRPFMLTSRETSTTPSGPKVNSPQVLETWPFSRMVSPWTAAQAPLLPEAKLMVVLWPFASETQTRGGLALIHDLLGPQMTRMRLSPESLVNSLV